MKNLFLPLLISLSFSVQAQDTTPDNWLENNSDTEITLPVNPNSPITTPMLVARGKLSIIKTSDNAGFNKNGQEEVLKIKISDATSDLFAIRNATGLDGRFIPAIYGHNATDNRISLSFGLSTTPSNDYGSEPLLKFDGRIYTNGETQEGGASVQNRNLCSWTNLNVVKMALSANGSLGIGIAAPQAQLHTTSSVRFAGLGTNTGNSLIMADGLGNLSRYSLPTSSLMAFATTSPTNTALPRFNSSNVLVNSQIFDNGTNIGIGGSPATNAKVTVYGVVNTLSDSREKSNITPIENALEKINQISGYNYNWNDSDEKQIGLIAQEVEKVLPEAVSTNEQGTKFLNYDGIIPVLTEAIKTQQKQITKQDQQIVQLENELQELKKMLMALSKK
jgi:hypothetical protein